MIGIAATGSGKTLAFVRAPLTGAALVALSFISGQAEPVVSYSQRCLSLLNDSLAHFLALPPAPFAV